MQERIGFKSSLSTLIYCNFFISLSAVTLTLSSYLILSTDSFSNRAVPIGLFVFFSSLFVYNFYITSYSLPESKISEKDLWIRDNKNLIQVIFYFSFAGIGITSFFLSLYQIVFLIHLALFSFLYLHPLQLGKFKFYLRKTPLAKIFILSYVWSCVTVFLPAMDLGQAYTDQTLLVFLERFLFILALAIPFDIRDFRKDKIEEVTTIPGLIGVERAKKLSMAILLLYVFISFSFHGLNWISFSRGCSGLIAMILIQKVNERVSDTFYMIFIDGVMIFQFIVLALFHTII